MRANRFQIALAASLGAAALVAGAVGAAPAASTWSRISGPVQAGSQLGLARTSDGVLHVIWNRGNSSTSIFETRLSPAGKAVGTSTVTTGWQGNGGLALVVMPDKTLRLFAPGAAASTPSQRLRREETGPTKAELAGAERSPSPPT